MLHSFLKIMDHPRIIEVSVYYSMQCFDGLLFYAMF